MPDDRQSRISTARAALAQLLELGRPPRILESLRALEDDLLRCHRNGVTQTQILQTLNEAGFKFSRTGFSYAYRLLLYERGILKSAVQAPTGPDPRIPRQVPPPRIQRALDRSPTSTAAAPAVPIVQRSSIRELLQQAVQ